MNKINERLITNKEHKKRIKNNDQLAQIYTTE
jgi:hypothetical protein